MISKDEQFEISEQLDKALMKILSTKNYVQNREYTKTKATLLKAVEHLKTATRLIKN